MHTINNQDQLNFILSNEIIDSAIDLYKDNRILLNGHYFVIDCQNKLFQSYSNIIFIGKNNTKVKLTNHDIEYPAEFDGDNIDDISEIPVFSKTFCIRFENVYITSDVFMEISFEDEEEFKSWKNVRVDVSNIRVVLEDIENAKFFKLLNGFNVRGIMKKGDHIVVDRGIYTHHGIYVGNNDIIHYSGEPGIKGIVTYISLEDFAKDDTFWVYEHDDMLPSEDIIRRAKSQLNADDYHLIFNNCEHFAHWCCTGIKWSNQVIFGPILGNLANDGDAQKYKLQR